MPMISVDIGSTRFNFRAAGVALRSPAQHGDSEVLLNRIDEQSFWYLPGGRVDIREASADALRREMQEELNEDVEVGRLLWIVENFYTEPDGKTQHELGLYYAMRFSEQSRVWRAKGPVSGREGDLAITFQWVPVGALNSITLYPPFLVEGLQDLPEQPTHILDTR